jgi:4-hydroxybenzoate polyprenyltransferase
MRIILTILRIPNLLIIALTFFILRYLVFIPVYSAYSMIPYMGNKEYSILIIITILIAAAGYISNDYFDTVSDRVNKPEKVYIGKKISPGSALAAAILLSIIAIIFATGLSVFMKSSLPAILLMVALGVAWWYAVKLKKSFLWGNIAVASMSAGTIAMAWLVEKQGSPIPDAASARITGIVAGISTFAFLLSLIREIIKDVEDMEGDKLIHCHSLPIVKGLIFTKSLIFFLSTITFALLIISQICLLQYSKVIAATWLIAVVDIPLIYFAIKLRSASTKAQFHSLSTMLKWIMLGGILCVVAGQF